MSDNKDTKELSTPELLYREKVFDLDVMIEALDTLPVTHKGDSRYADDPLFYGVTGSRTGRFLFHFFDSGRVYSVLEIRTAIDAAVKQRQAMLDKIAEKENKEAFGTMEVVTSQATLEKLRSDLEAMLGKHRPMVDALIARHDARH